MTALPAAERLFSEIAPYDPELANRARAGEFGHYTSPHPEPKLMLQVELMARYRRPKGRWALLLQKRVKAGEFEDKTPPADSPPDPPAAAEPPQRRDYHYRQGADPPFDS